MVYWDSLYTRKESFVREAHVQFMEWDFEYEESNIPGIASGGNGLNFRCDRPDLCFLAREPIRYCSLRE
jgi:hypothetical protein